MDVARSECGGYVVGVDGYGKERMMWSVWVGVGPSGVHVWYL